MVATTFVDSPFLTEGGPQAFTRQVERLLLHLGFTDVVNIDGSGDAGADLLATRHGLRWVFQAKWKKGGGLVDPAAVQEVLAAKEVYTADRAAVVTNGRFGRTAVGRTQDLAAAGITINLWDGGTILNLHQGAANRIKEVSLHPYQDKALTRVLRDLEQKQRALLVLATGLGKTYVAGEVINWHLGNQPGSKILVVAHMKDLVEQLERALWTHLSKDIRTQLLTGDERRDDLSGVTCATVQSALHYARGNYRPDLVVVDEAHHVGEDSHYSELLELTADVPQLGVTATPWRGDGYDIATTFGPPSEKVGIEDGMRLGYLAQVRYRLFADNIDWDFVRNASQHSYSIRDLNARLFLPGRDEAIRDHLLSAWNETPRPRGIVFCRSIEHAERMAAMLREIPQWSKTTAIHAGLSRRDRLLRLLDFRSGAVPLLTAVDILNEGVDVPDVNILCFARVTHSRRIFIQQLGRGLRVRAGKSHVEVLDFVSDVRRVAAVMNIREQVSAGEVEVMRAGSANAGNLIQFTDQDAEDLMLEWIRDAANLETEADEARLQFPET